MDGWVKLHRKIRRNPIFNDMELYRLWSICLTEASYKERDQIIGRQTVHLMPGEFVTGRFDLQSMYNNGLKVDQQKSPKTVWRWLEALEKGDFLTIKSTNKYSVISISNWYKYQGDDQQSDQQVTNKRPTNDQQVTTNKKVKKEQEGKEEDRVGVFDSYTSNPELIETLNSFLDARKKMKSPMTERAIQLLLGNLDKLGKTDEEKIAILNQSILNGWKGVFTLKKNNVIQLKKDDGKSMSIAEWQEQERIRQEEMKMRRVPEI